MQIVEGAVATLCVLSMVFFLVYVVGLAGMPSGFRPNTPVLNRFGEKIGEMQNPGYAETEDEEE
jgi:hypothetical protein